MSWSNCEQSNFKTNRLLFSRWFFQILRSRFSTTISLFILDSKFRWISSKKTRVISRKITIVANSFEKSNWFFETKFSCNENEISWSLTKFFSIFATLTKSSFLKKKLYVFAKISNNVFLLLSTSFEISWSIWIFKSFFFDVKWIFCF